MGRFIEHTSVCGTDRSEDENHDAEAMMKMFVNLQVEVITQAESRIHHDEEFAKFFCAEYFKESLEEKDSPLAVLHRIQNRFIIIQN